MYVTDGKLVKTITHEKLQQSVEKKGYLHDISVRGDKLALACRRMGVMVFKIIR